MNGLIDRIFGGNGLRWVKCEICTESFVEDIPKRHKYSQRHKRCGMVKLEIDELDKKNRTYAF